MSRTKSRWLRAGIVTAAAASLAVAGLAAPAYATNAALTVTPAAGPPSGSLTVSATGFLTGITTPGAYLSTAACGATYTTTSVLTATIAKVDSDSATITVPGGVTAPNVYKVCVYAGTTVSTSAVAGNGTYTTAVSGTLSATTGVAGGGNSITLTATGALTSVTTLGATFSSGSSCPATYTTTGTNIAVTSPAKTSSNVATLTVPTTVAAPAAYNVCLYAGVASTSALVAFSSATYAPATPEAALSATSGPNGGGNSITATLTGFLANVTTPAATFSVGSSCPATLTSNSTNILVTSPTKTADVLTMTVPATVLAPAIYHVCIYNGTTTGSSGLIAAGDETYSILLPAVTLSPAVGPTAGTNTITAASNTTYLTGIATPGATFASAACPSTYTVGSSASPYAATTVRRLSVSKAAITVPAGVVISGSVPTAWNLCIYNGTAGTSTLVSAPAVYTVAQSIGTLSILPIGGPAQGGSKVTVTGSGFPTVAGSVLTANIGGSPLTDITMISSTSFTGVTTPHVAGNGLTLSVTTAAGSKTLASAFSYTNGIQISPNTAPNSGAGAVIDVDVLGVGFSGLNFVDTTGAGSHSLDQTAHVYLVAGAYNPDDGVTTTYIGDKTKPPIAECTGVVVISDAELICTLTLTASLDAQGAAAVAAVPVGTYTVTTVSNGGIDVEPGGDHVDATYAQSIISSGSTFTVSPY
jgi:hypothetical protein